MLGLLNHCLFILWCLVSISLAQTNAETTSTVLPSTTETILFSTPTSVLTFENATSTTSSFALPTSTEATGWNQSGNQAPDTHQSWLKEHNRFVFIIVIGLLVLALLIWYIYRSIKGMRKRLERDNQAQLYMMQQASMPDPSIRNDRVIPEATPSPPPAYKTHENTPVADNHPI